MARSCIVTGGAGFIGCELSHELVKQFDEVIVIDNFVPQVHNGSRSHPVRLAQGVTLYEGDVTKRDTWLHVLGTWTPEVLVHLASETGTGQSMTASTRCCQTNVVGTSMMLDVMLEKGLIPQRIVLSSSRAVYGDGPWRDKSGMISFPGPRRRDALERGEWGFPGLTSIPADVSLHSSSVTPASVYGITKWTQEELIRVWGCANGSEVVILRLQNVYGVGQSLSNPYTGVVSFFCKQGLRGESCPVYEDGNILRDFVNVKDVVQAFMAALMVEFAEDESLVRLDVGSGSPCTILDLAQEIALLTESPAPVITGKFRVGDVRSASCSINRTVTILGWTPKVTLSQGLSELLQWIEPQTEHLSGLNEFK